MSHSGTVPNWRSPAARTTGRRAGFGIAAELLVTDGDNPYRMHSGAPVGPHLIAQTCVVAGLLSLAASADPISAGSQNPLLTG